MVCIIFSRRQIPDLPMEKGFKQDLAGETNATLNITDANATNMTEIIPWW